MKLTRQIFITSSDTADSDEFDKKSAAIAHITDSIVPSNDEKTIVDYEERQMMK